jgi:hypothetical protein
MIIKSDGKIGIGTESPLATLHISSFGDNLRIDGTAGGACVALKHVTALNAWKVQQGFTGADDFAFVEGSTARMTIYPGGNVGIGIAAPTQKLQVHNGYIVISDDDVAHGMTAVIPTNVYGGILDLGTAGGGCNFFGLSDTDQQAFQLTGIIGSADPTDTTPAMQFTAWKKNGTTIQALAAAETVLKFTNGDTILATLLGSGKLGINTESPGAKLEIKGTGIGKILFDELGVSNAYGAMSLYGSIACAVYTFASSSGDTNLYVNRPSGKDILFREGNSDTNGVVIKSGGNVGFSVAAPAEDVHAADTVRADTAFNLNGTDGQTVVLTLSAGTVLTFSGGILITVA